MKVTGTHIAYLQVCPRKLWLFANGITMEHTSDLVKEGKLIGETTYLDRSRKYTELQIDGIKIDFYDARNRVIHEVKKSSALDSAHIAQVKYYMYILSKQGIEKPSAILEYPKLRHQEYVEWSPNLTQEVECWLAKITSILKEESCPKLLDSKVCKKCSYYDFCYIEEDTP